MVGEASEQALLGRRRVGEHTFSEPWEVAGQEAGPDGVGIRRGEEGAGDGGTASGVRRRRAGDDRREELLRQARDLVAVCFHDGMDLQIASCWMERRVISGGWSLTGEGTACTRRTRSRSAVLVGSTAMTFLLGGSPAHRSNLGRSTRNRPIFLIPIVRSRDSRSSSNPAS